MSRLYYDTPPMAPAPGAMFIKVKNRKAEAKDYLEKVAKLIPTEILIGYISMVGLAESLRNQSLHFQVALAVFVFCLALTPIYLNFQAERGKPKWIHMAVSMVAFVVWAYAVSGDKVLPNAYEPAVASILLIAFSLVSGTIPLSR